jgi:hypothetical protein
MAGLLARSARQPPPQVAPFPIAISAQSGKAHVHQIRSSNAFAVNPTRRRFERAAVRTSPPTAVRGGTKNHGPVHKARGWQPASGEWEKERRTAPKTSHESPARAVPKRVRRVTLTVSVLPCRT